MTSDDDCSVGSFTHPMFPSNLHIVTTSRHTGDAMLDMLAADPAWRRLDDFAARLGFRCWTYSAAPTHPLPSRESLRVTTYPRGHVDMGVKSRLYQHCPALSFAFHATQPTPFRVVRQCTPMTSRFRSLLQLNRQHNVTCGMVIPVADYFGTFAMFALVFDGSDQKLLDVWHWKHEDIVSQLRQINSELLGRHARTFTQGFVPELTRRQQDVVRLLARGLSTAGIADELHITVDTVNKHVAAVRCRLGSKTTAQATALAAQWEMI